MSTSLWLSHCLRLAPSETVQADLSRLSPEEWDGVIRLAIRHGIAALLYGRLQTSAWRAVVPPAGAQRLHRHYLQAAAAGLRSQQQLGKLLEALSSRSVSVMVLGGAQLGAEVYGNVALWPTQELDLLVREEDCKTVASVLLSIGYGEDRVTGWYVKPHSYTLYVPPDEGDLPVRLHRQIVEPSEPYRVEVAELWADARRAAWAGYTALTLAPESLLLQTCISGSRDFPAHGVRCCYDVAQIAQHYQAEVDWGAVVTLAQRWRAGAVAHAVLSLAREVTGAPIPPAVIAFLKPESASVVWFPQTAQQLFDASEPQPPALVDTDAVPLEGVAAAGARAAVIHCLRGRWDPAALDAARREMLEGETSWEAWLEIALRGGVGPLLAVVLRDQQVAPGAVLSQLQDAYYRNLHRNLRAMRELARVLRALQEQGLQTLLLKGGALAIAIYHNVGLRPMSDSDLLVRREDAARAMEVLQALGYGSVSVEPHPGTALAYENEIALRHPDHQHFLLELHWGLVDSPYYQRALDMRWFWETAQAVEFEGVSTLSLGPEAQILHLCAHLMLHHAGGGGRLLWYHDIAEVLLAYRHTLDWDSLLARAAAFDLILPLQQVLPQVWEHWNLAPPAGIRERLAALQPSAGEVRIFRRLTAPQRPVAQRFFTDLASLPGWWQRWDYAWKNLFPAPAYIRERYHVSKACWLPWYYFWRWIKGLWSLLGRKL